MEISEIILLIQGVGTLIIGFFVVYQNRILKTQVENQNTIISNMKSFQEIIDIKKIKEYVELRELSFNDKLNFENNKLRNDYSKKMTEITHHLKNEEFTIYTSEIGNTLAWLLVNAFSAKDRQRFIDSNLPNSKKLFQTLIDIQEAKKSQEQLKKQIEKMGQQ